MTEHVAKVPVDDGFLRDVDPEELDRRKAAYEDARSAGVRRDAPEVLSEFHREVEFLLDRFRMAGDRVVLVAACSALARHTALEREILLPVLIRFDGDLEQAATQEERTTRQIAGLIDRLPPTDPRLQLMSEELLALLRHHVEAQESLWSKVRASAPHLLFELGHALDRRREELARAETSLGGRH